MAHRNPIVDILSTYLTIPGAESSKSKTYQLILDQASKMPNEYVDALHTDDSELGIQGDLAGEAVQLRFLHFLVQSEEILKDSEFYDLCNHFYWEYGGLFLEAVQKAYQITKIFDKQFIPRAIANYPCIECDYHFQIPTHSWKDYGRIKNSKIRCELCIKDRVKALLKLPHQKYLRTDHWKEVRASALERAGHRCELCFAKNNLHVHHKTYIRKGMELPIDLIVLCCPCHTKFHYKFPEGR